MTRNRILLAAAASLVLGLGSPPANALTISGAMQNDTSDNDNHIQEDAGTTGAWVGSSSTTIADVVGSSATVQRRFVGHAEAIDEGNITQSVDIRVTWTVTASLNTVYDITFAPELHGVVRMFDDLADETGDLASFSTFSASVLQNGNPLSPSGLNLAGGSRTTDGSSNVDSTATKTFTGFTGNNTFELRYTGTLIARGNNAAICGNVTAAAALWGMDGTLSAFCNHPNDFDEYATASQRDADGIFLPATVTITAVVPEPGTMLLLGSGLVGLGVVGRRRD